MFLRLDFAEHEIRRRCPSTKIEKSFQTGKLDSASIRHYCLEAWCKLGKFSFVLTGFSYNCNGNNDLQQHLHLNKVKLKLDVNCNDRAILVVLVFRSTCRSRTIVRNDMFSSHRESRILDLACLKTIAKD